MFDFAQPRGSRQRVVVGRAASSFPRSPTGTSSSGPELTRAAQNRGRIEFTAGDDALNRNDEFLYTLFVPARARLTFPCFDQPDLKARYTLTPQRARPAGRRWPTAPSPPDARRRRAPAGWRSPKHRRCRRICSRSSAGRFSVETATAGRPRDADVPSRNRRDEGGAQPRRDLRSPRARRCAWLEDYTAITYPFGKFDFVLIPSFQFGGMEHAGAILYNASSLLLDESATQNQLLDRASVIAHETSHMWFGDLVTMRWFNDVWMKEVFANFMAAKIVNPSFPAVNHELRFLLAHYPAAYQVDRTAGTNPIRQTAGQPR